MEGLFHFKDSLRENENNIFGYVYFGEFGMSNKIGYIKSLSKNI